ITFISGTLIAIDSSTRATLDAMLANVPTDIQFQARPGNATGVQEAVEAVPGVIDVATSMYVYISEIESLASGGSLSVQVLGVDPSHLPRSLGSVTITAGSFSLPRGTVALEEGLAAQLYVSVGGTASLIYVSYVDPYNRTTTSTNVTIAALFRHVPLESGFFYLPALALLHIQDVEWYHAQLGVPFSDNIVGEIRIDRDRFLDPYDLERSQGNLARLDRQIDEALLPFGGSVTFDYVRSAVSNFGNTIVFQRLIYLALSTPVVLLGVYLGAIGVDLGHAERRRELAVMKTRGATRRQLVGLLLVEAALGGTIAAVVGLLAGVGLSRLLSNFLIPFGGDAGPRYDIVVLSPSTVATVVVLSVLFMSVTSFRSARRTANLPIVETLRYYAPGETKIHYKPTIDVLLVALSITTYGMVLYSQSRPTDFLTFLLGSIFFVLLPFTPVFLIIGTTRLLTRSTGRIYEWTARAAKPFAKNLYYVISRNLQRNPRRSANVAVIIALGIAFGMFILVTFSSQLAYQERQIRASIGADIGIDAPSFDPTFGANLSALPDVVETTRIRNVPVSPPYCCASVHALDPDTYFSVTQPEWWYFRQGGVDAARQVLAT
ncbi:MAG: ABC transporter permease, partial [Thermoplasmata archaeon]